MNQFQKRRTVLGGLAALGTAGVVPGTGLLATAQTASAKPIVIGHQCELTGWGAGTGYWRNKAAVDMVRWINSNGGIAGREVKLVTVDTKSEVDFGVNQLRQLLLVEKVDFVIGAEPTSIALASNKLAEQYKTIYMVLSSGQDVTAGGRAVRHQFRMGTTTAADAVGGAKVFSSLVGKRWTVIYSDYAWGQSGRDWWTKGISDVGGEVVRPIAVPLDAQDLFPYVGRIDRSVQGIYMPVIGTLPMIQAIRGAGLKQDIVLAGGSFGLFDFREVGDAGEGVWGIESAPTELADAPDSQLATVYAAMGIDKNGIETATGKAAGTSVIVSICQALGFLKQRVEGSGWKDKEDNLRLIKQAEAEPLYKKSPLFPMGDVHLRAEDHQAFGDRYVVRVEKKRLLKKATISREQSLYPATADVTKL